MPELRQLEWSRLQALVSISRSFPRPARAHAPGLPPPLHNFSTLHRLTRLQAVVHLLLRAHHPFLPEALARGRLSYLQLLPGYQVSRRPKLTPPVRRLTTSDIDPTCKLRLTAVARSTAARFPWKTTAASSRSRLRSHKPNTSNRSISSQSTLARLSAVQVLSFSTRKKHIGKHMLRRTWLCLRRASRFRCIQCVLIWRLRQDEKTKLRERKQMRDADMQTL